MNNLWLDTETYSDIDLKHGVYKYAQHVEVMILSYAIDDGPVKVWDLTADTPVPADLEDAFRTSTCTITAHNAMFDRTVLRHDPVLKQFNLPIERWRCTMAQALAHSLPASLANLGAVLKVQDDLSKDEGGRALVMLFCKPRPKKVKPRRATSHTHPAEWARFLAYAGRDISAMRECSTRMPNWNYKGAELALWHLDQKINDRGIYVDVPLAEAALVAIANAQAWLSDQTRVLTSGAVDSATQRDKLMREIAESWGVTLPDMQKSTLELRINDPSIPEPVKELLRIRLQSASTSTSKYKTLIDSVDDRGRLCGTKQWCGASRTGRWAGRLFQPDNLPRPTQKPAEIAAGIVAIKNGVADLVETNVMEMCANAIRGCIIAPPDKKLVVADLSNIEGRVQAWLAGEEWKLQAFRDYDEGTGHDLYKLAYSGSFGVPVGDVNKDQRQIGKVQELALGYEGGVGAFVTFALAYKIDLVDMAVKARPHIPPAIWGQACIMLAWHRKRKRNPPAEFKMSDDTWLVCESLVLGWRAVHPNIKAYWKQLQNAARAAIMVPGKSITCGYLTLRRSGAWLRIILPSGRCLCYPSPEVKLTETECTNCNGSGLDLDTMETCAVCDGTGQGPTDIGAISYFGHDSYSRQWCKLHTYGGKLFENICQAVARDVMAHNMPNIEANGYDIVLTVHDEVVAEAPDISIFNSEKLSGFLARAPEWAPGLPLAAAGFEAYRYKKE